MNMTGRHWTSQSIEDFVNRISNDFVVQLEKRIEDKEITYQEVADRVGVTGGAVSQVLNKPGNLELKTMVQYAQSVGMKVAIIAYDDGDYDNDKGPIISEIFTQCWNRLGKPQDFFDLEDMKKTERCWTLTKYAHTTDQSVGHSMSMKQFATNAG